MVSLAEVEAKLAAGHDNQLLGEISTAHLPEEALTPQNFPHVHLDHSVDVTLKRMADSRWNVLPVVSRSDIRDLKGVVTLNGILQAYGIGSDGSRSAAPAREETGPPRRLVPGVIVAALASLILIGFLNYYYRSERGIRAEDYYKSATALAQQNRDDEAVEQFRNALSVSPGNARYRLALGLELVKMNRLDEGAVYLREVVKADPARGPANLGLARIAAERQRTSDAVTYYHRAIDASWPAAEQQTRIQARFELAEYLAKTGDGQAGHCGVTSYSGADPRRHDKKRIARSLLQYGSPRQAADLFRELARSNDSDPSVWAGLGAAELAQDNHPRHRMP